MDDGCPPPPTPRHAGAQAQPSVAQDVRRERWDDIQQTFMSYFSIQPESIDFEGSFTPANSAQRYEISLGYPGGLKAWQASLKWIGEEIGWDWVYQRIATLGRERTLDQHTSAHRAAELERILGSLPAPTAHAVENA